MLDPNLRALAGCPVIEADKGAMTFNPHPVVTAVNDPILAHEICHVLAGREDFEIFITAIKARDDDRLFRHVLNMLYDWYHESVYGQYSGYLNGKLNDLHKIFSMRPVGIKALDDLYRGYFSRKNILKALPMPHKDAIDLVVIADGITEAVLEQTNLSMCQLLNLLGIGDQVDMFGLDSKSKLGGPKSDIGELPKSSNYYVSAVARYFHIIEELTTLWKKNKYSWINNYYGEINWKDLPGMFQGEKLSLPVWRLFQKISMSRKIYLVIDRSGSTYRISDVIMDTAVIVAESLRLMDIPISVLDVGVTDSVTNAIDEPLDLSWFTPMSEGGTPLGEVCSFITGADKDSYLLIITDGQPDSWDTLKSALGAFPGCYLAFIIGDSYGTYLEEIGNAIHVEPHTIIREIMQNDNLS